MSAFEELGVMPELIKAAEDEGWLLPTPIQAEAIPLILGGGDVMGAAETGSGKTGAFALPVLQIVSEIVIDAQQGKRASTAGTAEEVKCLLSINDRDAMFTVDESGLCCQSRTEKAWSGGRGTVGAFAGKVYYEVTVEDEGLCRLGWSTLAASRDLGTDKQGFGFGGTGKKSHQRRFDAYGEPFGLNDVIGCCLDWDAHTISFTKNGQDLGVAFEIPKYLHGRALYPAICLKNAQLRANFGDTPLKFGPPAGFTGLALAPHANTANREEPVSDSKTGGRKPTAIILEPVRDLAIQTHNNITMLKRYIQSPVLNAVLLVGGVNPKEQLRTLQAGVDIVTGTPGRIWDLMDSGKLAADQVRFFVLDEADRLLDTGNRDLILKMFSRFPKSGAGKNRLQVLLFSATLHSREVSGLAQKICQTPILVDLKGKESVPDSVDHVKITVDPRADASWLQSTPKTFTDNMHNRDNTGLNVDTPECWSEAVKRLKQRLLQRIVDTFNMDQCLVFCRTNFDCDNLEKFLNSLDGGHSYKGPMESGRVSPYSCTVLAGARTMDERRKALQGFKNGDVRLLICTDVAARGLDIQGLPYVINMTLPDRSEDYIHRVGRVGRADTIGLAISLVSAVPEKVWYSTKPGYKPWLEPTAVDTGTHEEGGHTVWYNEQQLLEDIEERLHQPVDSLAEDLSLPSHIAARVSGGDGEGVVYGQQQRAGEDNKEVQMRFQAVQPTVQMLAKLEYDAQVSFFNLKKQWGHA